MADYLLAISPANGAELKIGKYNMLFIYIVYFPYQFINKQKLYFCIL
jgi:hypothetical protein